MNERNESFTYLGKLYGHNLSVPLVFLAQLMYKKMWPFEVAGGGETEELLI